jgi:hypothetical protein
MAEGLKPLKRFQSAMTGLPPAEAGC